MANKQRPTKTVVADIPEVEGYLQIARQTAPKSTDFTAVETMLIFLRTADSVLAAFEKHFAEFGISDGKYDVLMIFLLLSTRETPPSPTEIAEAKGVNRSTITGLLDGLEKAGFVQRVRHPTDRRALHVVMTEAGRELMDKLLPVHWRRCAALMGNLNAKQRDELVHLLRYVMGGLEAFRKIEPALT